MNIDERIQALTESVELLASFHRDTDERLAKLLTAVGNLTGQVKTLTSTLSS